MTDSLPPVPTGRRRDRELLVGLFVIVGVVAVFVALFTLTDASMFRRRYNVTTLVPDAGGIRKGDPVLMLGVNIGRVRAFRIVPQQGVAVRLEIEGEYKLPSDSRVEIKTSGLLAGMAADVIPGSSTTFLRGGETIPGSKPAQAFDKVGDIADQTQKTLGRVQALLSQKTVENVESSTVQLNDLLKQLSSVTAEQRKELAALTSSLRKSAEGVEKATSGPELQSAVKRLDTITERLDKLTTSLDSSSRSLDTVLGRIERGEGTLGRMAKDDSLYVNANEAAVNLNHSLVELRDLVQDIRKQPKKYLKMSIF